MEPRLPQRFAVDLIEHSPDMIGFATIDEPFRRVYVNPAGLKLVGLESLDEWNTRDIADLFDDADVDHLLDTVIPALREGKEWAEEADIKNVRTGQQVRVHRRMFPIYDESNEVTGFGTISRDITDLKEAQLEASEANERIAVTEERSRIARDFHDSALQGFASVAFMLHSLQNKLEQVDAPKDVLGLASRIRERLAEASTESRRVLADLRSMRFDSSTLEDALRAEIGNYAAQSGMKCELTVEGDPVDLSDEIEDTLLRVCQESLANAWKHGKPNEALVKLKYTGTQVTLEVCDDGMGFDPSEPGPRLDEHGLGLPGMRQRAEKIGGELQIESNPGDGCTVRLTLPLRTP